MNRTNPPTRITRLSPRLRWCLLLSAVLLLIGVTLWIKSYWKGNAIGHLNYTPNRDGSVTRVIYDLQVICGFVIFDYDELRIVRPDEVAYTKVGPQGFYIYSPKPVYAYVTRLTPQNLLNRAGFYLDTVPPSQASLRLILPCWFAMLLLALSGLPLFLHFLRKRRQTARLARGQCWSCGYDLRASKDQCPECGAIGVESP
jgi:hypothetical protein